jgi:ATP diphosphatase
MPANKVHPIAMPNAETETSRLLSIMARLRDKQTGCPWDQVQDFASIAPYTIEEAYEVADAAQRGDMAALKDELGDLLFQVVYHARLAEEAGQFGFADVAAAIGDKMIRRHPHVFGGTAAAGGAAAAGGPGASGGMAGAGGAAASGGMTGAGGDTARQTALHSKAWEEGKAAERREAAQTGALAGVPAALPALTQAEKLTRRAARVGFDWPDVAAVLDKLDEEVAELRAELGGADPNRLEDELGDMLFVLANLARKLRLDPEAALRRASAKFTARFEAVERRLAAEGTTPAEAGLERMEAAWQAVKRNGSG